MGISLQDRLVSLLSYVTGFRELQPTLDRLKEVAGGHQTRVCTVVTLWGKSHSSTVRSTSLGLLVVSSGAMPCQSKQNWSVGSIIIIILLLQSCGNIVVNLLVVLLLWDENSGSLIRGALEEGAVGLIVDVCASTAGREGESGEETGFGLLGCLWTGGGVGAAEGGAGSVEGRGAGGGLEGVGCAGGAEESAWCGHCGVVSMEMSLCRKCVKRLDRSRVRDRRNKKSFLPNDTNVEKEEVGFQLGYSRRKYRKRLEQRKREYYAAFAITRAAFLSWLTAGS